MTNTSPSGSLNVDSFKRAMLIYRNSIDPVTKTSPALAVFGRQIRDPIPTPLGKYCPHQTWKETIINREKALAKRHATEREKWTQHTRDLGPLDIGDHVYVQNLLGNHPLRWERTGLVVEVKEFNQYNIKIDGSGRVTLRNRKNLRKFTPYQNKVFIPISITPEPPEIKTKVNDAPQIATEDIAEPEPLHEPTDTVIQTPTRKEPTHAEIVQQKSPETPIMQTPLTPQQTDSTKLDKIPAALKRLLAHNKAGLKE